jgi:diaminopropionate ammonia-lyase
MSLSSPSFLLAPNPAVRRCEFPATLRARYDESRHQAARAVIERLRGYAPTPLQPLRARAAAYGVAAVFAKDESKRFGLGAFKSVGGAYAVARLLEQQSRAGRDPSEITLACASAGNHGRAVAWAARTMGARCIVYLYQGVSPGRVHAIEQLGATVVTTPPSYDAAVMLVEAYSSRNFPSI